MRTQNTSLPFSTGWTGAFIRSDQPGFSLTAAKAAVSQVAFTEDRSGLQDLRYYAYGTGFVTFPQAVAADVWRIGQEANYDLSATQLKTALKALYEGMA